MDRSLAKRIAGRASLTVEELLAVLDEARLGHDEKGFAADLSLYGDKDDEDSGDEGNPDPAE